MDLDYYEVATYLPEAERLGVSEIARSPGQFIDQLSQAITVDNLPFEWQQKRDGFIGRTTAQYYNHPTYRRWLSLIMWAFWPGPRPN